MKIRAIGLLLCGGLLVLSTTAGAEKRPQGNHCHCGNSDSDCLCNREVKVTPNKGIKGAHSRVSPSQAPVSRRASHGH
jgi:hypothetical protein